MATCDIFSRAYLAFGLMNLYRVNSDDRSETAPTNLKKSDPFKSAFEVQIAINYNTAIAIGRVDQNVVANGTDRGLLLGVQQKEEEREDYGDEDDVLGAIVHPWAETRR
jgi:hypothetical protein